MAENIVIRTNGMSRDEIAAITDDVPVAGSDNLAKSGGVYEMIEENVAVRHTTTTRRINLTDVKVGDDLSGATINFNPNNLPIVLASDAGLSGFQWILWTPYGGLNFGVIWNECFIQDASMNYLYHTTADGSDPSTLLIPNWMQDTYTFPEGAIVQNLYDLNGNRQSWQDFEAAMADTSWKPSMATVDLRVSAQVLGDTGDVLLLEGATERPRYNDVDIALEADIPTDYVNTATFNALAEEVSDLQERSIEHITGNTQYRENVDIPTVKDAAGNTQQIVIAEELTAHADHDTQMFNDLSAAILNNQFTPEQLQAIVDQAIAAADGTLVTDTELSMALKSMKNYADSLRFRQVIQIAKEDIDWNARTNIALSNTKTNLTVTGDSAYGAAPIDATWTADRDCYAYIKFNMYSTQAAYTSNGGGSQIRVFAGVNGKEVFCRVETLANGAWAGWTGTCWRKITKGDIIEFRSSKQQAIGYGMGTFSMDTFGVKSTALDGLDQKADKYFIDVERPVNFSDITSGMDLSGMTIELPPLDATNPQNLSAVIPLNFTGGGRLSFVLSDDGTVTVSAFNSSGTGQTLYEDGTSPLTPTSGTYTFPAGSIVDTFDPAVFDAIGGIWKSQIQFTDLPPITEKDEITIEDLYNATQNPTGNIPDDAWLIPSVTTQELNDGLAGGTIKTGDAVFVNDYPGGIIAYVKNDGSLATLPHEYPDGVAPYLDCALLFGLLGDHVENDKGYWQVLQQVQNQLGSMQALMMKLQTDNNDLKARVADLEEEPIPEPDPVYDMSSGQTLHTPPLLGALGSSILGIDKIGTGWTAPTDGLLVVDNASVIGLLNPDEWIAVNGVIADPSGSAAVLEIIGDTDSAEIKLVAGDVVTQSGMGNITFYKRIA